MRKPLESGWPSRVSVPTWRGAVRYASLVLALGFAALGCNSVLGNPDPGQVGSGGSGAGGVPPATGGASGGAAASGGASATGGSVASGGTPSGSGGQPPAECTPACPSEQGCVNGTCQPILPECMGQAAGTRVCSEDDASAFACGPTLASRQDESPCEHFCSQGECAQPPSCIGLPTTCGPGETGSCCASSLASGGELSRGSSDDFPAYVSDFRLDKYEVTVGRFRKFVAATVGGWTPAAGSGKHVHLRDGLGLVGTAGEDEAGWDGAWSAGGTTYRVFSGAGTEDDWTLSLQCSADGYHTWTATADLNETLPINCVNWYQAAAFCIWDEGFLPSEAEWEYAAAGGALDRAYPWGPAEPDATHSVHYCLGDGSAQDVCAFADILSVGQLPAGNGFFGQSDLAGNMWEWTADWFVSPYPIVDCDDCSSTVSGETESRSGRGGSWMGDAVSQGSIYRSYQLPDAATEFYGVRCARVP